MPLIQPVSIKDATESVEQEYLRFLKLIGDVPEYSKIISVSPELLNLHGHTEDHYLNHPRIPHRLATFIRLLAAHHLKFKPGEMYNFRLLRSQYGIMDKWIQTAMKDPQEAPLPENEKALLLFSNKALKKPRSVGSKDMDGLHDQGWSDGDIMEAAHLAESVRLEKNLYTLFKMSR